MARAGRQAAQLFVAGAATSQQAAAPARPANQYNAKRAAYKMQTVPKYAVRFMNPCMIQRDALQTREDLLHK